MIRLVALLLAILMICGCATFGPAPSEPEYSKAIEKLPAAKTAVYIMEAAWYPNIVLGDMSSFHAQSNAGSLFVTPEQLVFAAYDSATDRFLQSFSASYADMGWLTTKQHGLSRIIRVQINNSVHSFLFARGQKSNGEDADKDEVMQFVLNKGKK